MVKVFINFGTLLQVLGASHPTLPQNGQSQPRRNLSIHEYMSFGLLEKAGVPIPRYRVCETPEEVAKSAADLGYNYYILVYVQYQWLKWSVKCDIKTSA